MQPIKYIPVQITPGANVPRFGKKGEHRLVRKLIRELKARGFVPHSVAHDEYVRTPSEKAAMWEVFEVDECTLRFVRRDGGLQIFGVLLIGGNGEDMICDWSLPAGQQDWSDAMEAASEAAREAFQ